MPITDDQIDPCLRDDADPTLQFFRQNRSASSSFTSLSNHNITLDSEDGGDEDDDLPSGINVTSDATHAPLTAFARSGAVSDWQENSRLIAFGQAISRIKKLEPRSEAEFEKYCAVRALLVFFPSDIIAKSCLRPSILRNVWL